MVYFITENWNILLPFGIGNSWPFGIMCDLLVCSSNFGICEFKKNLATTIQDENLRNQFMFSPSELFIFYSDHGTCVCPSSALGVNAR
jgi:hypothetical protein